MKKITSILLSVLFFTVLGVGNASALSFLQNWGLNADGAGIETVREWIDTTGLTYVENTFSSATDFTFTEKATFVTATHDGSNFWDFLPGGEITALFTGSGSGSLNGALNFADGQLDIYYDSTGDYGTKSADTYGSTDGDHLATFSLMSGSALLDGKAVPNGLITIILESTYLRGSTWYDDNGDDMSLTDPITWILGFATTNASFALLPSADEIAAFGIDVNSAPPDSLWITNNGQYRLSVVPEPSTILLLGGGLLGLGFFSRRKKQ